MTKQTVAIPLSNDEFIKLCHAVNDADDGLEIKAKEAGMSKSDYIAHCKAVVKYVEGLSMRAKRAKLSEEKYLSYCRAVSRHSRKTPVGNKEPM